MISDDQDERNVAMSSVFKKIALVMSEIGSIPKDAQHQQGYSYQSIQAVSARLNTVMSKHGLLCLPSVASWHVVDGRYIVEYDMQFVDADSGDSVHRSWVSEATLGITKKDGGFMIDDKAMNKAHGNALKYFLLRTFIVSAQDDPDGDETDHYPTPRIQQPTTNAKASAPVDRGNLPMGKSPLVPSQPQLEDHLEPTDFATGVNQTAPTRKVEVALDRNDKPFLKIAGVSIFSKGVLGKLFSQELLEACGLSTEPGEYTLPADVVVITKPGKKEGYRDFVELRIA
jgi:hypothetical protein